MRAHVVAAIFFAAFIILIVGFRVFEGIEGSGDEMPVSSIKKLESLIAANAAEVAMINSRLSEMTVHIHQSSKNLDTVSINPEIEVSDIRERLENIEKIIEDLSSNIKRSSTPDRIRSLQEHIRQKPIDYPSSIDYMANPIGETAFETDSGKPLGDTLESISDVFVAAEDIAEVRYFNCRKSVCKVTYTPTISDPSSIDHNNEAANMLIDRLIDSAPDAELDISHARDDQGNAIMYIQLR